MASPGNCWDTIVVFNQHTLKNVLGGRHDIGNPNLHVAVDGMNDQQKLDAIMFLEGFVEGLADLPDKRGLKTVFDVQAILRMLPTILIPKTSHFNSLMFSPCVGVYDS